MKILVINGSPKGDRSNTYKLTKAFGYDIHREHSGKVMVSGNKAVAGNEHTGMFHQFCGYPHIFGLCHHFFQGFVIVISGSVAGFLALEEPEIALGIAQFFFREAGAPKCFFSSVS